MDLKAMVQLVMVSRSSWHLVHGLIFPVCENRRTYVETLTMASIDIGFKNASKPFNQLANMSKITDISIKHAKDAGIMIIVSEKICKPCDCYVMILDLGQLAIDWDTFLRCATIYW